MHPSFTFCTAVSAFSTLALAGKSEFAIVKPSAFDNEPYVKYTLALLAGLVVILGVYRVVVHSVRYIRTLTCLNNDTQQYFKDSNEIYATFKQHLLYAPLFGKRHGREIRIGPMDFGIIPTRTQSLVLAGIIAMNVCFCTYGIEWHGERSAMLDHLRNRTGTLAVVNMIPLVIMGGRNNPLIGLLNIPFDVFNLVHRWFGRIVMVEAVVHSLAHTVKLVKNMGWQKFNEDLADSQMLITGLVSTAALIVIVLQASRPIRHAFYETFLHLHIALIITTLIALWYHLVGHPSATHLKIVIICWALERLLRLTILIYRNVGRGGTYATIEALPGDAVRVNLTVARPWTFHPGQHLFLTIPSIGLWTSHPFSIAWSSNHPASSTTSTSYPDAEKGLSRNPSSASTTSTLTPPHPTHQTLSLVIRSRTGFTSSLHARALASPTPSLLRLPAYVSGPHGTTPSLSSYGTLLLFAGGVGITHHLPHIRSLVISSTNRTTALRRLCLVWIIQSPEHLEWIRPWMTEILGLPGRREVLRIQLWVTRPRSSREVSSPSATVQMFPGRPNVGTVVEMEFRGRVGAMGVGVCGPGGLGDEVRGAVRGVVGRGECEFLETGFGW